MMYHLATMYSVTDGQTDGHRLQQYDANSRSYCVDKSRICCWWRTRDEDVRDLMNTAVRWTRLPCPQ